MRKNILFAMAVLSGCGKSPDATPTDTTKIQFTASGEKLALTGYSFSAAPEDGTPVFIDGWEVTFTRVLVTVDNIVLSSDPDKNPSDQKITGPAVAKLTGPWAIDLHKGGPLVGKGGDSEQAVLLGELDKQNLAENKPFDPTQRYAFGYDIVAATASAKRVNIEANDADYKEMTEKGWTTLYVGKAEWKGGAACKSSSTFDYTKLPQTVNFRMGFKTPTTYLNCQNPDTAPAKPLGEEEFQRGVQLKSNQATIAQLTIHTDHPFWDTSDHESAEPYFDQFAAIAKVGTNGVGTFTLDDAKGVNYTAFTYTSGGTTSELPWRSCVTAQAPKDGQRKFAAKEATHNPSGTAEQGLRDYADYISYITSTMGHLNSDGLCAVERHYPSPP